MPGNKTARALCAMLLAVRSWLDFTAVSLVQPVELRARPLVLHSWLDADALLLVQHV